MQLHAHAKSRAPPTHTCTPPHQGVRPASLQRVADQDLAEFIAKCISPRAERPRARNLLKHPYFDSMRLEKCALKLSADALAAAGRSTADLVAEAAGSFASSSVSRTSSNAGSSAAGGGAMLFRIWRWS